MIIPFLRYLRTATRQTGLRRAADAIGLTWLGHRAYSKRVLTQGVHRVRMMGQPICFEVGTRIEIDRIDSASEQLLMTRMLACVPAEGRFWDVGANIGVISICLATARPKLAIEAFEPETRNAQRLRSNLALNGLAARCRVHEMALSNVSGKAPLKVDDEIGAGTHSLDVARRTPGSSGRIPHRRTVEVIVRTGDDLALELGSPAAIKIDVEGAELLVIDGLRNTLKSGDIHDVFIELHTHPLPLADGSNDCGALLEELGFERAWEQKRGGERHCHFHLRADRHR